LLIHKAGSAAGVTTTTPQALVDAEALEAVAGVTVMTTPQAGVDAEALEAVAGVTVMTTPQAGAVLAALEDLAVVDVVDVIVMMIMTSLVSLGSSVVAREALEARGVIGIPTTLVSQASLAVEERQVLEAKVVTEVTGTLTTLVS